MELELQIDQKQMVDDAQAFLKKCICPYMRTQCSQDECLGYNLSKDMSPEERREEQRDEKFAFTRSVLVPTGRVLSVGIARCRLGLFENLLVEAAVLDGFTFDKEKDMIVGPDGTEHRLVGGVL